jgi:hypothetical protein
VPEDPVAAPLLKAIQDLLSWLASEQVQAVVIGGVAASILGRPRVTRDVDVSVVVDEANWPGFLAKGGQFGFTTRISDALDFARQSRVLLVQHAPTGTSVDVVFAVLPYEKQAITRAKGVVIQGVTIPLPTPEDLIIMKAVARRPRDLIDIEAIVDAHPDFDHRYVRRWLRDFATALEMPEIVSNVETILRRPRKPGR